MPDDHAGTRTGQFLDAGERVSATGARPVTQHVVALDVLRGIAAMVVLLGHCTLVYGLPKDARRVIDVVLNQRAAVLIFFVLSGYVLTYAWLRMRDEPRALMRFYVRRMFRLMPALWVASLVALVLLLVFPLGPDTAHLSRWLHDSYRQVEPGRAFRSFLAVDNALVPPTWTISIEIFGSLIVPLLVGAMAGRKAVAAIILIALLGASFLYSEAHSRWAMLSFPLQFAAGCGLALFFWKREPAAGYGTALGGLLLIFAARPLWWILITGQVQTVEYRTNAPVPAVLETVGAVLLIAALASRTVNSQFLEGRSLRALGDWSYSIYLIHFPVLRLLAYSMPPLHPVLATVILAIATVTITCALAALIFRHVERPGIALGKRMTAFPPPGAPA